MTDTAPAPHEQAPPAPPLGARLAELIAHASCELTLTDGYGDQLVCKRLSLGGVHLEIVPTDPDDTDTRDLAFDAADVGSLIDWLAAAIDRPAAAAVDAAAVTALSAWIDNAPSNQDRDREALAWHRVMKVAEEAGEVTEAMIGYTGGNPRKGHSHSRADVVKELLDTALAALCAVEHLNGNRGDAVDLLAGHVQAIAVRAGLAPTGAR
jgi:NTP pyrophosphatase (non-canonical NTP hydrolase)